MGVPAAIDHAPVGVVAIHGDVHAAAAGGNAGVEICIIDAGKEGFEGFNVVKRAGFRHVAAVEQSVDTHRLDALFLGADDHRFQVVDVAMHIAIGKQADEMDNAGLAVDSGLGAGDDLLPGLALPDGTGGDGVGDQRGALTVNLAGADGVVADFRVTHVFVRRHADGGTVGAQTDVRVIGEEAVERWLRGRSDGTAGVGLRNAVAVHDDGHDRAFDTVEVGKFIQHDVFLREMKKG